MEKITTKVNWTHIKDGKPDIEGPVLVVIHIGGMNPVVTEAYFVDGQFYEDIQAPCLRTCAGLYAWAWKPAAPFWEEESEAMREDFDAHYYEEDQEVREKQEL